MENRGGCGLGGRQRVSLWTRGIGEVEMWVRGQLAKADLQRDEGGSRSPIPPEQSCWAQVCGPARRPSASGRRAHGAMWMGRPVLSDRAPERTLPGPGATARRNEAGLSLCRTCPTGHQGPSNCVHSSPTWGRCPQQPLGWAEDCASLLLGPGEEHGERTDTSRPAESEVRGWCPRERADVCIGVLAA